MKDATTQAVSAPRVDSQQQEALEAFERMALDLGIHLHRASGSCYPPACRIHEHEDDEKRLWAQFADRLARSTKRSTKPRPEAAQKGPSP